MSRPDILLVAVGLFLAGTRIDVGIPAEVREYVMCVRSSPSFRAALQAVRDVPRDLATLLRVAGVGLVMLVFAYPLTFTVRAYADATV